MRAIRQATSWGKTVVVGIIDKKIFRKSIQGSKHFLRQPRAIAISAYALDEAEKAKVKLIEITDTETGKVYSASLEHFRHYSFSLQRGFAEKQYGLVLDYWCIDGVQPRQMKVLKQLETASQFRMF